MPTYMKNVVGLDIKQNALLSALPYFVMWMTSLVMSTIADMLINKQIVSLEFSRKLFNSIGLWGPMCALLGLAFVPKGETQLAIGLLTLAVGINAATYLGFQVNHIDLAPNHAGTMMGITNCAANIMSILAPLLVGFVLEDAVIIEFKTKFKKKNLQTAFVNFRKIQYNGELYFSLRPESTSSEIYNL
jgi:MFS transporter, ACS family, solute carrier family 17 (sodium-dependent inorganic phosphate cotransporter), member 5